MEPAKGTPLQQGDSIPTTINDWEILYLRATMPNVGEAGYFKLYKN